MQTITQSVVESHTKLVYKYIKQDVEAENNQHSKRKSRADGNADRDLIKIRRHRLWRSLSENQQLLRIMTD